MLLTRAPVAGGRRQASSPAAPRLACVKPVASVHPEPGSNSSLLYLVLLFFQKLENKTLFVCFVLSQDLSASGSVLLARNVDLTYRIV